jgi:hypothetical protein
MPNILSQAWVKNVYSLRIARGLTGGRTYTESTQNNQNALSPVHKHPALSQLLPVFKPDLSTVISRHFNLLINYLYPLSTHPTITETKEN